MAGVQQHFLERLQHDRLGLQGSHTGAQTGVQIGSQTGTHTQPSLHLDDLEPISKFFILFC